MNFWICIEQQLAAVPQNKCKSCFYGLSQANPLNYHQLRGGCHAKLIINAIRTLFGLSVLIGACVCLGKWLSDRFDFGRPWQVAVVSFHIVKPNRNARNISFARLVARHFS
jgi:hypothetical protein